MDGLHSSSRKGTPMSRYPTDGPADPSGQKPQPPRRSELPQFKVILHSGSGREAMFIVNAVMELTHLGGAEATHKMWEAHHSGRSQLITAHRERAELYVEQFAERGLTVTLEAV
jgi:ATP-dependent Clp protease adaptor protein ClpS